MRALALASSIIGIAGGVLMIAGPVLFGTPARAAAEFVIPALVGVALIALFLATLRKDAGI